MTFEQILLSGLLLVTVALFVHGRWAYELVALGALFAAVAAGLVPAADAFSGFADPAVATVALVLILSRGLVACGAVQIATSLIGGIPRSPTLLILALAVPIALLSAFINNVGALALFLPVALRLLRERDTPPSQVLMPLSFASMLGGMCTLVGTPPNIIVSAFREQATGSGYSLFAFAPVGVAVAIAGIAYLMTIGWRAVPVDRKGTGAAGEALDIGPYLTEIRVEEGASVIGTTLSTLEEEIGGDVRLLAVTRGKNRILMPNPFQIVRADDILVIEATPEALEGKFTGAGIVVEHARELDRASLQDDRIAIVEAVVLPNSPQIGRSARSLRLRETHNLNLLAMSRMGHRVVQRLRDQPWSGGDVLLLQGGRKQLDETMPSLGLAPLAERPLQLLRRRKPVVAVAIFVAAIAATAAGLLPPAVAFLGAVLGYTATRIVSAEEAYRAIEPSVLIVLAAMLPLARAFSDTGLAGLIAEHAIGGLSSGHAFAALAIVLVVTMGLSDFVNNAATAAVMSPIALATAKTMNASPDAFLMAVAIGASCAFLTPIGHQNNLLVMGPGGYRFGDYWRVGLPLEFVVTIVGLAAIRVVWW
ncbi:SLC13 family permease [Pinisolibacter sp.]|uniref:SLC13 family permease n=1 Tax=Pinisolibacter sp. TaxID=2172024 RepID=UPI002FDEBD7F